ncbi:hypothetical protein ACWX0K_10860 [Nitrobacteraceae bacterium UC4446_H13]
MTSLYLAAGPRQLDIVADTVLAKAPPDLSTARALNSPPDLSTKDVVAIDRRRRRMGISVADLLAASRVSRDTFFDARAGRSRVRPATVARLRTALDRLTAGADTEGQRTLCVALLRVVTAEFARRAGWDAALMLSQSFEEERPQDPVWLQAARLRRCAIYVLVEGLMIRKAHIGHAIGCSRQAVHKAVAVIEQERDRDAQFDALMQTMMDTVKV